MSNEETVNSKDSYTLPALLYWEWRASVEELTAERKEKKIAELELKVLTLEAEKLKLIIEKKMVQNQHVVKKYDKYENDFKTGIVKKIEDLTGFALENCAIDPVTFEVRKL